jgi:arylsulfatase A-like enzyme
MRDPFAPLTRKQRLVGLRLGLQRIVQRPWRPSRLIRRQEGPPNLVLVGVDTLRHDHATAELMPNLLAHGTRGVDFADTTATAPWTLPSFASALTGLMPTLHGARLAGEPRNMDHQPPDRLRPDVTTLAAHLERHGYATCAIYANQFFAFGLAESFAEHRYLNLPADAMFDAALEWIRRHADRPFCCFVLLNDPHEPTTPHPVLLEPELARLDVSPPTTAELRALASWGDPAQPGTHLGLCGWPLPGSARRARKLKSAIYRATVHQVDLALGRFLGQLDAFGLTDHTLCSVFSDHGEEFCDHAAEAHGWDHDPRKVRGIGHGHTQFQELLHVPWFAWGAGVARRGSVAAPVSLLDLAPTVVDWLGLPPLPLPAGPLPALVGQSQAGAPAAGADRLLLAEALAFGPDVVALRRGHWKLVAHRDGRPLGLYDLQDDPRERDDRQQTAPDVLEGLRQDLKAWREAASASGPAATDGKGWDSLDDEVRQRLKDLGYGE